MKTVLRYAVACAVMSVVFASPALAIEQLIKPSPGLTRAEACAQEAKGRKGEEHDRFMNRCLKDGVAVTRTVNEAQYDVGAHKQQNRMKTCNQQAGKKDLHGDERRSFMSTCLKG
ncbi:MAG: phosphate starvation-inducible protein [Betaproteobacteria bacterium]|nr:phosphate starvation-inducible protein [Betaproteobacteria bacterium]